MHPTFLTALTQAVADGDLTTFVHKHQVELATIGALKAHAATFYFSEPNEALRISELAYAASLCLPAPAPALGRWALANALLHTSRLTEADSLYRQARHDYLAAGDKLEAARMGVGHVAVLAYLGQPEAGLELASQIKPVLEAAARTSRADRDRLAGLLLNMGVPYELAGRYEESLAVTKQLIQTAEELEDDLLVAQAHHNHAHALVQLGAFDEALVHYAQAEQTFRRQRIHADWARLCINRGNLLAKLERFDEAKAAQAQARALLHESSELVQLRQRLALAQAQVYLLSQTPLEPAILTDLQEAQHAFAQHGPLVDEGLALVLLARAYLQQGEQARARQTLEQASRLVAHHPDSTLAYQVWHGLGQVAQQAGQPAEAVEHYQAALQQIESVRHALQIEQYRAAFLTDKLQVYQDLAALYLQQNNLAAAFEVVERAKSRLVTEKLAARLQAEANSATRSPDPIVQSLAQKLTTHLLQLDALYEEIARLHRQSGEAGSGGLDDGCSVRVQTLENQVQTLTHLIQQRQPLFSNLVTGQTVSLETLQSMLSEAIFLQYHMLNRRFAVFLVDRNGLRGQLLLGRVEQVEQAHVALTTALERLLNLVVRHGPGRALRNLPQLLADANQQLQSLHALLVAPLLNWLPIGAPLIISPAGLLYYLPFQAFFDGQTHLIERHPISYAPSATVLDFCQRVQVNNQQVLLCGYADDQLPAVAVELATLQQLFPAATCLQQTAATTVDFLAQAPQARLIHLVAHATFRVDNPMLSSIHLADRRLTMSEVARLALNAELVTLSGCETGRGQLRGTDLLSLAGGFLGAGARALLVSLWRVEDQATARLMAHFYQARLAGEDHAQALRSAQLALLQQGRTGDNAERLYAHPAYWSPFILIGR
jgi:CHAT domain-containing protein